MQFEKKHWIYRKWFLISVALLLLNDFYFKYSFHNYLTGKLSDIVGLFAFSYFMSNVIKNKTKLVYIFTGLLFIFWKSSFSQPFIDFFNDVGLGLSRVIDYSDLIALCILPLSYLYRNQKSVHNKYPKVLLLPKFILIGICSFAFIATSLPKIYTDLNIKSQLEFQSEISKDTILKIFDLERNKRNYYNFKMDIPDRRTKVFCKISILEDSIKGITKIRLDSIKNSVTTGKLFLGHSNEDVEYIKSLKIKDYEILFIEKVKELYKE